MYGMAWHAFDFGRRKETQMFKLDNDRISINRQVTF